LSVVAEQRCNAWGTPPGVASSVPSRFSRARLANKLIKSALFQRSKASESKIGVNPYLLRFKSTLETLKICP
jgi:hypothetical protein